MSTPLMQLLVWLSWIAASTVGALVAAALVMWEPPLGLVLGGVALGLPQWFVLQRNITGVALWMPITCAAVLAGYALEIVVALAAARPAHVGETVSGPVLALLVGCPIGLVVGIGQAAMLNGGRVVMWLWTIGSVLGASLWVFVLTLGTTPNQGIDVTGISVSRLLGMGAGGFAYGLATGTVLLYLLVGPLRARRTV